MCCINFRLSTQGTVSGYFCPNRNWHNCWNLALLLIGYQTVQSCHKYLKGKEFFTLAWFLIWFFSLTCRIMPGWYILWQNRWFGNASLPLCCFVEDRQERPPGGRRAALADSALCRRRVCSRELQLPGVLTWHLPPGGVCHGATHRSMEQPDPVTVPLCCMAWSLIHNLEKWTFLKC